MPSFLNQMNKPICPLCSNRRAKRACPSLGKKICAVCCGTKRNVEIRCPSDCIYLRSSHTNPPAVVQRQRERDFQFILPLLGGLSERQREIAMLIQWFLRTNRPNDLSWTDMEIEQAAKAAAETFETSSRGIVYEHRAASLAAQRLSTDLKEMIDSKRKDGARITDTDTATALRFIEAASRDARHSLDGTDKAYVLFLNRLRRSGTENAEGSSPKSSENQTSSSSRLILPG